MSVQHYWKLWKLILNIVVIRILQYNICILQHWKYRLKKKVFNLSLHRSTLIHLCSFVLFFCRNTLAVNFFQNPIFVFGTLLKLVRSSVSYCVKDLLLEGMLGIKIPSSSVIFMHHHTDHQLLKIQDARLGVWPVSLKFTWVSYIHNPSVKSAFRSILMTHGKTCWISFNDFEFLV